MRELEEGVYKRGGEGGCMKGVEEGVYMRGKGGGCIKRGGRGGV